jgi:CSLREA domain-containing protein
MMFMRKIGTRRYCYFIVLSVMVAALGASVGFAATFTVNSMGDSLDVNPGDGVAADGDGLCTLRAAIMEANALYGVDEIVLPEGIVVLSIEGYGENDCREGDLDIFSNLTIRGAGKDVTIIDGNEVDRVFHIRGAWHVTFKDLTIKNGKAETGWSIPEGEFTEKIAGTGKHGGGILNYNGILTLENVALEENIGGRGGDAPWNCGSGGWGGGIYNTGRLTVRQCSFKKNVAGRGGGVYGYAYSSLGTKTRVKTAVPSQITVWPGDGGHGGAICNHKGKVEIELCEFSENSGGNGGSGYGMFSGGPGGALYSLEGEISIQDTSLIKNSGGNAGGFEDPGAGGFGGAIYVMEGKLSMERCLVYDNQGGTAGWCYYVPGGYGGGLYLRSSDVRLVNTTISYNSGGTGSENGRGGGVYQREGKLELVHCTVYHNNSGTPGHYAFGDGGGGVHGDNVFVKNSIIAGNRVGLHAIGNDFYGTMHSQGYNLLGDLDGCDMQGDLTGNIIGEDPLLKELKDNGGALMTHALAPGSPAIDAADPLDTLPRDQRGADRPKDGDNDGSARSDMGAYEHAYPSATITGPAGGQAVWGVVDVTADCCDAHWVEFYVDGHKAFVDNEAPYEFQWDTTGFFNGPHRVRALACDKMGQAAGDEVTLFVDNALIHCSADRKQERGWLVRKEIAVVEITVDHDGGASIDRYSVQRKKGDGEFQDIAQLSPSDLNGGSYTYIDLSLDPEDLRQPVQYRIMARESDGSMAGLSNESAL